MATAKAVEIHGLSKRFKDIVAVDNVSFEVERGEIFGFMGHNGAGKTTTIRMLLGLLTPTGGKAKVLGYDIGQDSLAIRRQTGFLPAEFALPKELTPRRFLRYVGALFGLSGRELDDRIETLLGQFGLANVIDKKLGQFSTGMAQKVGLAQALINQPQVVILDEPTSGLDPIGRHELLEFLRDLAKRQGVTVLFSTHILSDVERICERVAVMHRGRLIASGGLSALKSHHASAQMDDLYLTLVRNAA